MRKSIPFLFIAILLWTFSVTAAPVDSASAIQYARQYYGALARLPEKQVQTLPEYQRSSEYARPHMIRSAIARAVMPGLKLCSNPNTTPFTTIATQSG